MAEVIPLNGMNQYQLRVGKWGDHKQLLRFMQRAYQDLCPEGALTHLSQTVEQLWSEQTALWFVEALPATERMQALGCLWLGTAIDPVSGDRYTHIFLVYVDPPHRRCGLGSALMNHAEQWAMGQGHPRMGLHVYVNNRPALSLYQGLGYTPHATFLQKNLRLS